MRLILLTVLIGACATGSTYRSGVGDKFLEHPPYYAGTAPAADAGPIGHLPVGYQRGSTQSPVFEPAGGSGTPIAALLADMTAYLDSLGVTVRVGTLPQGTPPDVRFSCKTKTDGPDDACATGEGALGDGRAIRIGAEGLLARRTNLLISAIGGQALITDAEVEQLRTGPAVWHTALRHLVRGLTGR
jgi:hypothetical protein